MKTCEILDFENLSPNFGQMIKEIRAGNSCSIFGIQNSMRPAICAGLKQKFVFVVADGMTGANAVSCFEMMGLKTVYFPAVQDSFLFKRAQSNEFYVERTLALFRILNRDFDVVVVPASALYSFLPSVEDFKKNTLKLSVNQNITIETLERLLVQAGYKREEMISEAGQFSRRGEIVDVFPLGEKNPFRIDFFDTVIETIKIFDVAQQKGTKPVDEIKICPFSDLFLTDEEIDHLKHQVTKLKKPAAENGSEESIFNNAIDDIISRLELKDRSYSMDSLAPYLDDFRSSIFDYLNAGTKNYFVVIDECKQVYDAMESFSKETSERVKNLRTSGTLIAGNNECFFQTKDILSNFENNVCLAFLKITNSNRFFKSKAVFNFKTQPVHRYTHNLKDLVLDVRNYLVSGSRVFIFAGEKEQADSISRLLASHDIELEKNNNVVISGGKSAILEKGYNSGFVLPEEKVVVLGTYDLFAKKRQDGKLSATKSNVFSVPKVGDYVVHQVHGIGVCEGVTQLTGNLGTKDYVVIRYRDNDKLYIPTTQMDMLEKFTGADVPKKLSKIGGQDFSAVKAKVKESVKKLAFNLIELYAKRESIKGFAFSEDNDLQREFENSFPYTETEDQLISIEEIKQDMEKPKVMDRLVCGDVGFGKTEVALRAMFKAIMDGKQVAFIAPTTILSEQHYNTARARMYNFGINIEVLNRFKTKSQTDKILAGVATGEVDLLCGTHRILSDDVCFKSLGLIVLDEEQKFGVEDKEKLKVKYPNADVLTLSATPIPRTLNMSLTGIRDISIISTPPSERLAIQTYVAEYSETMVKDAINRELARDGQVFILFNSVEKIYTYAEKVRRLVPDARILVAHGQMGAKEMERVIYDFYHRQGDILICTTIIENGVDIENANTLIVCDADKLGLSQLYQIRGRVGRGSRLAYAYFTYEGGKVLGDEAYKRLDAMSEFCEFGSGFKLAMRDLEIRGGGNVLGAEQSGHLQKVGFDMYSKLLSEAVKELRGEKVEKLNDVLVKIAIDAYIPEEYIATSEERMIAYKRISSLMGLEECEKLKVELVSNYGPIPNAVLSLMEIALVRKMAQAFGAVEISSIGAEVSIIFDDKEKITESEILGEAIYKFRMNCKLDMSSRPMITFSGARLCRENFEEMKKFLLIAMKIKAKNEENLKK
ncbi:MAG: transcription-repair coupling factor [Clostridiales bacterium]|nr:transcription-repair coupling factor [Clostridiales bacterium]